MALVNIGDINIGVVSIGVVNIGVVSIGVVIGRSFGLSDGSKVRNFDKSFCVAARNSKMRKKLNFGEENVSIEAI